MKLRGTSIAGRLLGDQRGAVQSASFGHRILELICSDSSGSALVELAFALPVYLILITGMVSTVMALYSYQQLAFATFAASEAVGANRGKLVGDDMCALAGTQIVSSLPAWTTSDMTMDIWITQNVGGTPTKMHYGPLYPGSTTSPPSCKGDPSQSGNGSYVWNNAAGEPVTVRVSYTYSWFPIYSNAITTGPLVAAETSYVR
jgi:hypothetical protein